METAVVRISVIIPTRNRAADLGRCLTGLAECVRRAPVNSATVLHEVLIVDDASTDPDALTPATSSALPVTLLRNPVQLGAGASRQRAAEIADGDLLAFLDDDAIPRGDWLLVVATVTADRPAITGRVLGFDDGLLARARQARYDARYRDLSAGTPVTFFSCGDGVVLASAFRQVGGFANDGVGGDNSLAAALARRGTPVRFAPDLVIAHRNRKGWLPALHNAWSAGTNQAERMTIRNLPAAVSGSAVGDTLMVREVNRALGILNVLGRIAPGARGHTLEPVGMGQTSAEGTAEPAGAPATRCTVGVLGLGYAGLPEAIAFADAGHHVVGVDVRQELLRALRAGRSPLETVTDEQVSRLGARLVVSDEADVLAGCSAVLVCVPTPLDDDGLPDLDVLRVACGDVAAAITAGQLVVIESTVHPGVTESVVKPILEKSGLRAGIHFSLAFAPERVDPGNPVFSPTNTPRVVGGLTPVCARRAGDLYRSVVPMVHMVSGLRAAEAAKMLENTYRQVNLALVNEFAAYCAAADIDVVEVIDAAATKPFGFQPFYPGVGVGGHCIPVDPMYLAHAARELGMPLRIVELAQEINDERPARVADECAQILADSGKPVDGAQVLLLGVTYKPGVADVRNTPAVPLIRALTARGIQVRVHDPLVPEIVVDRTLYKVTADLAAAVRDADLVLLAQRHDVYGPDLFDGASVAYQPA